MKLRPTSLMLLAALCATACSDNDNEPKDPALVIDDNGVKITVENLGQWTAYAEKVATDINADAQKLLQAWETDFANKFKQHASAEYPSAKECIEEIIEGCADIADEVGDDKLGDPIALIAAGKTQQALFALESWFSMHSKQDYVNNIISVRNSYYGSLDGSVAPASIAALTAKLSPALDSDVRARITAAAKAIADIPDPMANNLNSNKGRAAIAACRTLAATFDDRLEPFFEQLKGQNAAEDAIVANYVDAVVLPTYRNLAAGTQTLLNAVQQLAADPTDANFKAAAEAWYAARAPWEQSEAFLFGPAEALGLAKSLNAHPTPTASIAAQTARGFHALEYLLFSNGEPRTLQF